MGIRRSRCLLIELTAYNDEGKLLWGDLYFRTLGLSNWSRLFLASAG